MIAGGKSYFGASYWGGPYWGGAVDPNAPVYGEPVFVRRVLDRTGRPGVATARDVAQRIGGARLADTAGGIGGAAGWTRRRIGKSIQ